MESGGFQVDCSMLFGKYCSSIWHLHSVHVNLLNPEQVFSICNHYPLSPPLNKNKLILTVFSEFYS